MADLGERALGMMQMLAAYYSRGEDLERGPDRALVDEEVALDAVMQLFAVVDQHLQAGRIPKDNGLHAIQMLMIVREFIRPIPGPPGDEELFEADLAGLAEELRRASP
jgi:hypothetical protein